MLIQFTLTIMNNFVVPPWHQDFGQMNHPVWLGTAK